MDLDEKPHGLYHVWTLDTDRDLAMKKFIEQYGYQPEKVMEFAGYLWLGPIKENHDHGK